MTDASPVTTRVGGRFSARAAVVVVALTLSGIVGVAVVNRPPAPPAAQLLVPPSALPTQPSAPQSPSPTEGLSYPPIELGDDASAAPIEHADVIIGLPAWPPRSAR